VNLNSTFRSTLSLLAIATLALLALFYALSSGNPPVAGATSNSPQPPLHSAARNLEPSLPSHAVDPLKRSTAHTTRPIPIPQNFPAAPPSFPENERHSFDAVLSAARRKVNPLSASEASLRQNEGVYYFASNPEQHLNARFFANSVRLERGGRTGHWAATMQLAQPVRQEIIPTASGETVEYHHPDGTVESYENRSDGIEHSFIVQRPINTAADLRLKVSLQGLVVRPSDERKQDGLLWLDPDTQTPRIRYNHLKAWDAKGKELAARFEVSDVGYDIVVDASNAAYPVTIDPLITALESMLEPQFEGDGAERDFFGTVALSADTAVIGAQGDDTAAGGDTGSAYVFLRSGTNWVQQAKLLAADPATGDALGRSVAIEGDRILLGAQAKDTGAGAVYIFERIGTNWIQSAKMTAADRSPGDNFGNSVALSGETALVGALFQTEAGQVQAGAAYVFIHQDNQWTQQAKLTAPVPSTAAEFGYDVSLSGDTAVVGSPFIAEGRAYLFTRSGANWNFVDELAASDGFYFGFTVAISENTVAVGAPYTLPVSGQYHLGSAYVFINSGSHWFQQAKLTPKDPAEFKEFGSSIAIDKDSIVVGASGDDFNGSNIGSAYVFIRQGTQWTQQARIIASIGRAGDGFGGSVAISKETILSGTTTFAGAAGPNSGAAFVFVQNSTNWVQQAMLTSGDGSGADYFASSVALLGDRALVGMPGDDTAAARDTGSAYLFLRNGTSWTLEAKLTADLPSLGDRFGHAVALGPDVALVGAPENAGSTGAGPGSAYIFEAATQWKQKARLKASDGARGDWFGGAVAISPGIALVGAYGDDNSFGADGGSAYVFASNGTNWNFETKLQPVEGNTSANFGISVALSGQTAVIGGNKVLSAQQFYVGGAFIFVRDGTNWTQQARLNPVGIGRDDEFGYSVAISGDTVIVGSPQDDLATDEDVGSAYIFLRNGTTWSQQAKILATTHAAADRFGYSVGLSGDTAVIGAPLLDKNNLVDSGSVSIFVRNGATWTEQTTLPLIPGKAGDRFGSAVAISGDSVLIGAPYGDAFFPLISDPSLDRGNSFAYRLQPILRLHPQDGDLLPIQVLGAPVGSHITLESLTSLSNAWSTHAEFDITVADQIQNIPIDKSETSRFFRVKVATP
jgi:hypothetical protein